MKSRREPKKINRPQGDTVQKKDRGPFFKAENKSLPPDVQAKMESSFGEDFSGVEIHKDSGKATELNALAFTQGESIHFAPGQFNPSGIEGQQLIGHELAHVVQQRSGIVNPTNIIGKGIKLNEDKGLEQEADSSGRRATAGSAISTYHSAGLGMRNLARSAQAKNNVVQRFVDTSGGRWDTEQYDLRQDSANGVSYPASMGVRGVDMKLKFTPGANVDAELIGLTQSVQAFIGSSASFANPTAQARAIGSADAISINTGTGHTDEGTAIDRAAEYNNPIYPVKTKPSTSLDDTNTAAGWGQNGWHFSNGAGAVSQQDAKLFDKPTRSGADKNSRHIFETTALATKGVQAGTYYGSVRWGWQTDSAGAFTKLPLSKVSDGVPSSTFMKAAGLWNASKTSTGADSVDLPLVDVKLINNPAGVNIGLGPVYVHLPAGTRVRELPVFVSMIETAIEVVDGPFIGQKGNVNNSDLRDERP